MIFIYLLINHKFITIAIELYDILSYTLASYDEKNAKIHGKWKRFIFDFTPFPNVILQIKSHFLRL